MAELLLVNPARRKSRKRNPKRARRRKNPMPRPLAHYWATHSRKTRRRRKNPHHASGATTHHRRRAHHPRRRKSNPSFRGLGRGVGSRIMPTLKQGFVGAIGGIGNDLLMGQVLGRAWLPSMFSSGVGAAALKALGALAVGVLGGFVWRGRGRDLGDGAMTVALHDFLRSQVQPLMPASVPLGEYLSFAPTVGYSGMGEYLTGGGASGMGEYITSDIGNPDFYGSHPAGMLN